jgi:hypothetical protein
MATTTTKSQTFERAFAIDATALRRLWEIVYQDGESKPKIIMECSDNSQIETDDIDELLDFPNLPNRRIDRLSLRSSYSSSPRIRVALRKDLIIGYEVAREDRDIVFFSSRIEEILRGSFTWYSRLFSLHGSVLLGINLVLSNVTAAILEHYAPLKSDTPLSATDQLLFRLITIAMLFGAIWVLWRLIGGLFLPSATFLIGAATKPDPSKNVLRFLGGIIVTVLVGLVANWLYGIIWAHPR